MASNNYMGLVSVSFALSFGEATENVGVTKSEAKLSYAKFLL